MSKAPKVTVVIPLYNTEKYIAEALRSVLNQNFSDYEVVVVNDASTDVGPKIVEDFMREDKRIRMLTQENRGLAGARNTGIRHARGEYIALLDADDFWTSDKLELHVKHLDDNPEIGVSYAPSIFIDDDSAPLGLMQQPKIKNVESGDVFCRNPVGNGSAAVIRAMTLIDVMYPEIFENNDQRDCWFDESFRQSEDIEMWTRIATTTAWKFGGVAKPLTYYRVNSGGLSANIDKQMETWQRFADKVADYAPAFYKKYGNRAKAYQLRYLARRAAISGAGIQSLGLMNRAVAQYPKIIWEEMAKTLQTYGLGVISSLVPEFLFNFMKQVILFGALTVRVFISLLQNMPLFSIKKV